MGSRGCAPGRGDRPAGRAKQSPRWSMRSWPSPVVADARAGTDRDAIAAAPVGWLADQRLGRLCRPQTARLADPLGAAHPAGGPRRDRRVGDGAHAPAPGRPHAEAQHPGDLVCLDAFYVGKLKGVGKVWQLTACDAACSFGIATLVPRITQQTAIQFLREHVMPAYARANHRIRAVLTDGGPEWQARFLAACRELGISHRARDRAMPGRTASSSGCRERSSPSCGGWPFAGRTTGASRSWSATCRRTCASTIGTDRIKAIGSKAARRQRCSRPGRPAKSN